MSTAKTDSEMPPGSHEALNDDAIALETIIRARAYELYVARGMSDGYQLEDWLQAEEEIIGPPPELEFKAA